MKNILIVILIHINGLIVFGQGTINLDNTTANPHKNAILDIKADSKGVIFPKVADITKFPFYNKNAEDLFDDKAEASGSIIFNQEDKQYYKYNGKTWVTAKQLAGFDNPHLSRIKNNGTVSFRCVLGIGSCAPQLIPLTNTVNISQLLVNNLAVPTVNNIITIKEDGIYNVAGVIGFEGTSVLSLGQDIIYRAYIEVQYPGSDEWMTLAFKETAQFGGLFVDFGQSGNKSASVTTTANLVANTKIRMGTLAKVKGVSFVSTYTTVGSHTETFINITKIK